MESLIKNPFLPPSAFRLPPPPSDWRNTYSCQTLTLHSKYLVMSARHRLRDSRLEAVNGAVGRLPRWWPEFIPR